MDIAATPRPAPRHSVWKTCFSKGSLPFWLIHVAAILGVVYVGFSWQGLLLAYGIYALRMFFLTAGYHRYFAHRSYKTSRAFQLVLAVMGGTCAQMGPLWWAANHRLHHKHSDQEEDLHSPSRDGFMWSHIGWHMSGKYSDTRMDKITDFAAYPELVWLNQRSVALLPAVALAVLCGVLGGMWGLVWGFLASTVILWHGTFTINSLSHVFGRRRYATKDTSKNNFALALLTLGEGWHNNHHHYQSSARQGFFWWEIDITYYLLRGLSAVGVIWDLRQPPRELLERAAHTARVPAPAPPVPSAIV